MDKKNVLILLLLSVVLKSGCTADNTVIPNGERADATHHVLSGDDLDLEQKVADTTKDVTIGESSEDTISDAKELSPA